MFVTAGGERGGAETVLLTLLRRLDRSRFQPLVCCLSLGPIQSELARLDGVEVFTAPVPAFRHARAGWRAVRRLRALIGDRKVALVHANGTGAHLYAGVAARLAGVPAIFHAHDLLERGWSGQGLVNRLALRVPASAVVTPSRFLAASLEGRTRAAVVAIANGLEEPRSYGRPTVTTETAPAPKTVAWCARLQHWKGAHVFLEAAARVRRTRPDTRFVVIGGSLFGLEPGYDAELRRRAAAEDLAGAVRFTGHVDDPTPELAGADLVVHSAIRPEPFGLVIVEAMFLGRAVVAAGVGGPAEIVEPGVSGMLVAPDDPVALADAVDQLLGSDARRAAMGEAGRARARALFGAATMARRFESLYLQVLASGARSGERRDVA